MSEHPKRCTDCKEVIDGIERQDGGAEPLCDGEAIEASGHTAIWSTCQPCVNGILTARYLMGIS